jgi:predicted Zn-dependent peptidase
MFSKTVLENGITVVRAPIEGAGTTTILAMVRVGSRDEHDAVRGGAHYIEHLMFKGTKTYPTTQELSRELDSIGAKVNAFTSHEYTGYYVKSSKKHGKKITNILFDMLENSLFDEDEMEREKKVIIEEIKMYEDNPRMHIYDLYHQAAYQGDTLSLNIAGTKDSVRTMDRDDVLAFRDKFYGAKQLTVVVSGSIEDEVFDSVVETFSKYSNTSEHVVPRREYKGKEKGIDVVVLKKDIGQGQMVLGFPGLATNADTKELRALKLMSIILGGNMSSRLFINIRERKGLCYSVSFHYDNYDGYGTCMIDAGVDKDRIEDALQAMLEEAKKMKESGVTEQELQDAKTFIEGHINMNMEDSFRVAHWYAHDAVDGIDMKTPEEVIAEYNSVTVEDVRRVAQKVLSKNHATLAVIGPFDNPEKFRRIIETA